MAIQVISKNYSILRLFNKVKFGRFNSTRNFATFNFIDDKKTAEETVYFKKQGKFLLYIFLYN